jgi:hypothetical protein
MLHRRAGLPGLALLLGFGAAQASTLQVDSTGCLHVTKTGPSETCTTDKSLTVDLINTCKFTIRAQLCLRGADHLWVACEPRLNMGPKEHLFQSSCDSDGAYTFWGCAHYSDTSGNCGGDKLVGKASNVQTK